MDVDEEIKTIKEQVAMLCDQFNTEYREFVFNEERRESFYKVFKSLDHLNGVLTELYYIHKMAERRKKKEQDEA